MAICVSATMGRMFVGLALFVACQGQAAQPATPMTSWGAPDLNGLWNFKTATPLERPDELGEKSHFTEEEARDFEAHTDERTEAFGREFEGEGNFVGAELWMVPGDELYDDRRTSLIVDPADGKIPERTPLGAERLAMDTARIHGTPAGPEDRGPAERCLLGFNSGPPMNPTVYNDNVQIFQTKDHIVLLNEMVHDARIIPLDGRPPLPDSVRQWRGDSRGYWEGDTLVVETANFSDVTTFFGTSPNMHLTERLTRIDDGRLTYEYTVDDPDSFTEPWTAVLQMNLSDSEIYEYACHEANRSMTLMLESARDQERLADLD